MPSKGYTVFGWLTWQIVSRVARRKLGRNRAKVGALLAVVLVVVAGLAAARAAGGDDD